MYYYSKMKFNLLFSLPHFMPVEGIVPYCVLTIL